MADLAVGIGFRPGTPARTLLAAIRKTIDPTRIHCLATIDRRAEDLALIATATELGVPIVACTPAELSATSVPNPATRTANAVGTASVAEAAALCAAATTELLLPKRVCGGVTIAAAHVHSL
ncbi:cobalamin biosynthesis protein [Nocardia sp. CDC159]|uniref:Cobalamin biosynthesis protein n=1 Tax=Nocardia pulmonis TaxID=2951408 RepID=A0A9X2E493_9NOCA|nr:MULTISPECIES: cobalamin biosynthesis protein [Nocardia]MCM6774027.1 cobalamin biosynthesis protein [Nocardia pulmonis]MCM6786914.1 cobalamin biosynthesis protein [Nocardia sp. CDC159]